MPKGIFNNPVGRAKRISQSLKRGSSFLCLICGKAFWRKPCAIKKGDNKFCSKECYFRWQKGRKRSDGFRAKCGHHIRGDKNPKWKGGITPLVQKIRHSPEINKWREAVFERDNWTCQECRIRSKKNEYVYIQAHHVKPFMTFPHLRFEITNGITLCKKCHDKKPKGKEILCLK